MRIGQKNFLTSGKADLGRERERTKNRGWYDAHVGHQIEQAVSSIS